MSSRGVLTSTDWENIIVELNDDEACSDEIEICSILGQGGEEQRDAIAKRREWKGVVPHCANTTSLRPSAADAMQVYHLPTDPFETTDIAERAAGKAPLALLRGTLAEDPTLSCHCFQC